MAFIFSNIGVLTFCRLMTPKWVLKQTVKTKIKIPHNAVFHYCLLYSLKLLQSSEKGKPFFFFGGGGGGEGKLLHVGHML